MFTTKFLISFTLYSLLQSFTETTSVKSILDDLEACKRNDPELNGCLLKMLIQVKPYLMQGNSELNLPTLDPMFINKVPVIENLNNIKITGALFNVTAKGARSMSIKNFKVNLEESTLDMTVVLPLITFIADFDLNATLNFVFIPFSRKGQCEGKIRQSVVRIHADGDEEDGKLKVVDFKVNLHVGDLDMHIIKSQNPSFKNTMHSIFNTNKRLIADLVTPVTEDVARHLLLRFSNRILSMVNIEDLLVD